MTTDQLFIKLPQDLQWEILETFIGTHVVRNGTLRRKLIIGSKYDTVLRLIKDRPWYNWLYKQHISQHADVVFTKWFYYRFYDDEDHWETPINKTELIVLTPFIKHTYSSYPYTNTKLGRTK